MNHEQLNGVVNSMLNGVKIERIKENLKEKKVAKFKHNSLIAEAEQTIQDQLGPSIKMHLQKGTLSHHLPQFNKLSFELFDRLKAHQIAILETENGNNLTEKSLLEIHYESMSEVKTSKVPARKRIHIKRAVIPYWIIGLSVIILSFFLNFVYGPDLGAKGLLLGISIIALGYRSHVE